MRRLPVVILVMVALLVAVVTGCGAHRYDGRLVAADSLIAQGCSDSALATLEALPTADLTAEGDRAYHGLLLAQARYKSYVTATSDSDINRALTYYRTHSDEREKLTRAYIYKGAVMEELGHPDSAMLYYKHAEATAAPDDYFNQGYSKMRMGALYSTYYTLDGKDIEKYEEALDCFKYCNDTNYILMCMNNLGCLYRMSDCQESESIFQQAAHIARTANDTNGIVMISHSMIVLYHYYQQYDKAWEQIHIINSLNTETDDNSLYFCIANVFSRLGQIDSALYYIRRAQQVEGNDPLSRLYYFESLSEVALAENDSVMYHKYLYEANKIADSLKSNATKIHILNTESFFDKETKIQDNYKLRSAKQMMLAIAIIAILSFMSFVMFYYKRKHYYDELISEIKRDSECQLYDFATLQHRIDELQIKDAQLKDFIMSHTSLMREIIEACYHEPRNKFANEVKQIIKYQEDNKDNWAKLYDYIDIEYNDIIKKTKIDYPHLNEKDLLLLALSCLGYSCAQIAIIMGYANATCISGNRQRLAKKMGLNCTLSEYIAQISKK